MARFAGGLDTAVLPLAGFSEGGWEDTQHTGTKALMVAILEEGIRSYLTGSPRIRREAECWVTNPTRRSPFAFAVVCETLGLEPEAVRAALRRMKAHDQHARSPLRRSRPNVRRTARLALGKTK